MKIGIVSPYFGTIGGGERYMLTAARFFLNRGDRVDIFSGDLVNSPITQEFFGLDLRQANFIADPFFGPQADIINRITTSIKYDLMFFLSDGSIPISFARQNWLHFQTPFQNDHRQNFVDKLKLSRFRAVICNSKFTKYYIDRTYGVDSRVVYPPVDADSFVPGEKENLILAVGRYAKRQEVLVKTFSELTKDLNNWRLVLIGSADSQSAKFIEHLQRMAKKVPIEIVVNPSFKELKKYYAAAKIFWHAVGYGENLDANPARAEHFGITTVEAMAAGAVPVVFSAGGQKEIVQPDSSGFLWETLGQLKEKTKLLINNDNLRQQMADKAIVRSKVFGIDRFFANLEKLLP